MISDFKAIVVKLPMDAPHMNIYPMADLHIGDPYCNETAAKEWANRVAADPYGYFVLMGDLMNAGLKNSKTNVYEEKYTPSKQKEIVYNLFKPIISKNLVIIPGNHEYRFSREAGLHPLYDLACEWGVEDNYRDIFGAIDVSVGHYTRAHTTKQVNYGVVVSHGSSRLKHQKWSDTWDGADLVLSGHTHDGTLDCPGKLIFDHQHKSVRQGEYYRHVCTPWLTYGGYGARAEYHPGPLPKLSVFTLLGNKKRITYREESL